MSGHATPIQAWLDSSVGYARVLHGSVVNGKWRITLKDSSALQGRGRGASFEEAAADALNDIMRRQAEDEDDTVPLHTGDAR